MKEAGWTPTQNDIFTSEIKIEKNPGEMAFKAEVDSNGTFYFTWQCGNDFESFKQAIEFAYSGVGWSEKDGHQRGICDSQSFTYIDGEKPRAAIIIEGATLDKKISLKLQKTIDIATKTAAGDVELPLDSHYKIKCLLAAR
jgi:hypothetical protein